jgi:Ser/Thr protein kinase RdoA (MazF antagonist)
VFLVKRLRCDNWRQSLERAMGIERRARAAGIAMPRPLEPVSAAFGYGADIDGDGVVRAYEWVDGEPIGEADVAEWLGTTLARLHQLAPTSTAEPDWYGLHPPAQWEAWLAQGTERGRVWAPELAATLPVVLEATHQIATAFSQAQDYVLTHRDFEPWNVMVTAQGPVLIDWDTAGPDSARLEAAHTILAFSLHGRTEPDPDTIGVAHRAYIREGGAALDSDHGVLLARRVGLRLGRLSERLCISLGEQEPGSEDIEQVDTRALDQLRDLPDLLERLTRWAAMFTSAT